MNILRYLFPLLLTTFSTGVFAGQDTIFVPSAGWGVEVSGLARHFLEPETMRWEFSAEYEWKQNWFAVAEAGWNNIQIVKPTHEYESGGAFFRAGADLNLLQRNTRDKALLSARYGFGRLHHQAPFILIEDPYWGNMETSVPREIIRAHWLELGGGMKAQIAGNFFLGWTLRARWLISSGRSQEMTPYYISGYGKNTSNLIVAFHYSIYYNFPLR
jgi:hypothetical protein